MNLPLTAARKARAEVQIDLLVALISAGDYQAARALAQNPDLLKSAGQWKDTRVHLLSAATNLALTTGDYSRARRLLREWRESGTAASEGTLTWYLTLVGDYRNANATGLLALDPPRTPIDMSRSTCCTWRTPHNISAARRKRLIGLRPGCA
jgi:hypothetical protein